MRRLEQRSLDWELEIEGEAEMVRGPLCNEEANELRVQSVRSHCTPTPQTIKPSHLSINVTTKRK
jgi:hypothetical protein